MVQALEKIWIYNLWYKGWYKIWYKIYKLVYKSYKLYKSYSQALLDVGYLVGTPREQAGVLLDGEGMDEG